MKKVYFYIYVYYVSMSCFIALLERADEWSTSTNRSYNQWKCFLNKPNQAVRKVSSVYFFSKHSYNKYIDGWTKNHISDTAQQYLINLNISDVVLLYWPVE